MNAFGYCVGFRCMIPLRYPTWHGRCPSCREHQKQGEAANRAAVARGEELRDEYDSAAGDAADGGSK